MNRKQIAAIVMGTLTVLACPTGANAEEWEKLGLLRIRDMTPFGLSRLDFLPAHPLTSAEGTWGVELTLSYQNTWAMSENVREYLEARGAGRRSVTAADVGAILALPGDAYLVDGEYGLVDLTMHYKTSTHFGLYLTIPYYYFDTGHLDAGIENFHQGLGFDQAERDLVPRNQWRMVAKLERAVTVLDTPPENDLGDPVLGVRYSLKERPADWNLIVEGAVKIPRADQELFVSTGEVDFGMQLSLQRFFRRNALYAALSGVYFDSPDSALADDQWIPTAVIGWETRLTTHLGLVLQLYASRSTVQETDLPELSADKFQATLGLQWMMRGNVIRLGLTENLANYNNTPDVGLSLSFAHVYE
jgi:hypothetical protein